MDDTIGPRRSLNGIRLIAFSLAATLAVTLPAQAATVVDFEALPLSELVPPGTTELRVTGVPIGTVRAPQEVELDLISINVFAPDARVTVQTPAGELVQSVPGNRYFAGTMRDRPHSVAVLAFAERGGVRGYLVDGSSWWRIGQMAEQGGKVGRAVVRGLDAKGEDPFECGNGDLPGDLESLLADLKSEFSADLLEKESGIRGSGVSHTARIAFETDEEYLVQFGGDTSAAVEYVGDLVAFGSTIYADEVGTSWIVGSVNLWTTTDPWSQSPGSCALYEFGKYWNDNNDGIERTTAHMLSGKTANSGTAWVGVLCRDSSEFGGSFTHSCAGIPNPAPANQYAGAYGFTGGIDGNFDINNPGVIWDSFGVLHEIGHNFSSPHTHCYEGIGGNNEPVDKCGSQSGSACYNGANSLPLGCPGAGNNCGTIMSYCHLLSGGLSGNISLVLGENWPYGVEPDRVPDRMAAHVAARAAADPACLALVATGDPDLIVESPGMDDVTLASNQNIDVSATVRNQGSGSAAATTLRYFYSTDSGITASDTEIGTDEVVALGAGEASPEQLTVTGPPADGTYWYGACVDGVENESNSGNNCSSGVEFSVSTSCVDDDFEFLGQGASDDACFGTSIAVDALQGHMHCDEDWVRFQPELGATYVIQTGGLEGGADTTIALHEACGPEFAFDDNGGPGLGSQLEWTATSANPLDIRIREAGDSYANGEGYILSITCTANCMIFSSDFEGSE